MKKNISFLYRLLVIISLFVGIALNIFHVSNAMKIMAYYTLQVNVISLATFVIFEILDFLKKQYKDSYVYYLIKGELIVSVVLMMIVYVVALTPKHFQMTQTKNKIADIFVHVISPIMIIIDYALFDEKGNFKYYYPIIWTLFPITYVIFVYTYSYFGGKFYNIGGSKKYAYPFLDFERYGITNVFVWTLLIGIVIIIIGMIIVFFDRKIKLIKFKKKSKQ